MAGELPIGASETVAPLKKTTTDSSASNRHHKKQRLFNSSKQKSMYSPSFTLKSTCQASLDQAIPRTVLPRWKITAKAELNPWGHCLP